MFEDVIHGMLAGFQRILHEKVWFSQVMAA